MSTVRLGDHELLIRLAAGGAANVFLVRDVKAPPPGRLLALKILLPSLASNDDFLKMFFAEAKLAGRLVHKNVVTITGFGLVDGIHCLAMEYVFGASLSQVLRASARAKKPLTVGVLLRITADVCDALHYAHELKDESEQPMGVVHRDVTPQNILIGFNGVPKLTDFGIAKATNRGWETQAGIVKGKFSYMSPEQALGKRVDRRSDIFGTGIVLWEALTGRDLFKGSTPMEVLNAIREQKIEPPSKVVEGLTPIVDPIVMKALRRSPKQRYQTAAEMRDDIEDLIRRAGVAIDSQTISREFAAIYGDEIVERAFALRAAMAGKPDLENLARVLGGAMLNPKHLPTMIPGGITDPDPLGLFSDEIPAFTNVPESQAQNGAMPARNEFEGSMSDEFEIEVAEEAELSNQEIAYLEPDEPSISEVELFVPSARAISGWDDSTGMVVPDDELLSMLSEEDATIGYLPPKFADRFGVALKKALEEDMFDEEATVGIGEGPLKRIHALNRSPGSWEGEPVSPVIAARPLRPIPRAPSLDMIDPDRSVPRAPSLDMDGMTPLPELEESRAARLRPPTQPMTGLDEDTTGPELAAVSPMVADLTDLLPHADEPHEPPMPGDAVLFQKRDLSNIDDGPTHDEPRNGIAPHGANLEESVLLEPANPLSPDDLRALDGDLLATGVRAAQPAGVRAGQPAGVRAGQPAGVRAGQPAGKGGLRAGTPPPLILPPPELGVPVRPATGLGKPSAPGHRSNLRANHPATRSPGDPLRPGSHSPPARRGIRLGPATLIMMILGLVALGLGLGILLATQGHG